MNQRTHAWLAVQAFKKVQAAAGTAIGKKAKLDDFVGLLDEHLTDVVTASWLPDSLIKDNRVYHIFKSSLYIGDDQVDRFTLSSEELTKHLPKGADVPKVVFGEVDESWWSDPFRVREESRPPGGKPRSGGGHLPSRIAGLSLSVRDMFLMGDAQVVGITGFKPPVATSVPESLLYSPRNIATALWIASHYVADAHVPMHCDARAFTYSTKQFHTHAQVEDHWGKAVPEQFDDERVPTASREELLATMPDVKSPVHDIDFGGPVSESPNHDPWLDAVYMCRASLAVSFAIVPASLVPPDDPRSAPDVSNQDVEWDWILDDGVCGEEKFWNFSRAVMKDAVDAIAMFWVETWADAAHLSKERTASVAPVPVG